MTVAAASLANLKPPILPGETRNPGGKPVGARNAINAKFLKALTKDFDEGGEEAIRKCRLDDPSAYVRALIALQPKELEIVKSPFAELSDEQLESIFATCNAILSANGGAGDRGEASGQSPQDVPALSEAG